MLAAAEEDTPGSVGSTSTALVTPTDVSMLGSLWCCTCSQNMTEQTHFAMLVAANKQMKNTTEWTHSAMLVVANKLMKARNKVGVGLH